MEKRLLVYGIVIILAFDMTLSAEYGVPGGSTVDTASSKKEIPCYTETGQTKAQLEEFEYQDQSPTGIRTNRIHVLTLSDRDLIWVGHPHDTYACMNGSIVGMTTGPDTFFFNQQQNKLSAVNGQAQEKAGHMARDFHQKNTAGTIQVDKKIRLDELLTGLRGMSPFLLPLGAHQQPAKAPTITEVHVDQENLTITLTGENKINVVLVFDGSMNVIKGLIGGKVQYTRDQ
ncbi:MAG: hypothetical protein L6455_05265 [Kiritimatiellae bacterium]|nr:hypothetical protein [Kiritimatiellia bacterium]